MICIIWQADGISFSNKIYSSGNIAVDIWTTPIMSMTIIFIPIMSLITSTMSDNYIYTNYVCSNYICANYVYVNWIYGKSLL